MTISAVTGLQPAHGYAVALDYPADVSPWCGVDAATGRIDRYMHTMASRLTVPGLFLGVWLHDGHLFLDIAEVFTHESVARDIATVRKQFAYHDIAAGADILLADSRYRVRIPHWKSRKFEVIS